jgi:hypothetical protein
MVLTKSDQEVTILNGYYHPQEAQKIICNTFKTRMDDLKMESMKKWVRDHSTDLCQCLEIEEKLTKKQEELMDLIEKARHEGREVEICTTITVKVKEASN